MCVARKKSWEKGMGITAVRIFLGGIPSGNDPIEG